MRKIDLSKIKVTGVANNSVLVYNNVSSSWVASNTVAANVDWSYIGNVPYANSTANGVVKIVDSTANTSNSIAASANSVKVAFDAALANGATAYANAVTYTNSLAATAYSNAVTQATTLAATAYSNATSYADTKAATAYSNAIGYAAANSYVNTQLGLKADLAGATFTGAVTVSNTISHGNTTITGFANITGSLTVGGVTTISGNLVVNGTTVTVNTSQINVTDSLLYLASNNEVSDSLDIGLVAHYNNGSGANGHTGFFRSATTKKYYLFQNYQPEFFSNNTIDIANTATGIQMADLVVGNLTANSTLTVTGATTLSTTLAVGNTTITGFANVSANLNTSGTLSANVITVTGNVTTTQNNLQVDPAGTAAALAIIFGG